MKHAKPSKKLKRMAVIGLTLGSTGAIPLVTASAATMDSWNTVAQCESGGDWSIESGDPLGPPGTGASAWGGGLQFQPASWDAAIQYLNNHGIDTSHFGVHASGSTKDQQILAAEALLAVQPGHPDPWACDPNQILGPSMFDGGANPWGLPGAQVPAYVIAGLLPGDDTVTPPPPPPAPVSDPTPPPVAVKPKPVHRVTHGTSSYTIVPGDCLWTISGRLLGDPTRWPELYAASHLRSGDPDLIFPGEVVNVPAA